MLPLSFPARLIQYLMVICAIAVLCIGETEINRNVHSYEIATANKDDEKSSNQRHVVSVCENNILHAKCGDGKVIRFLEAHYGRLTLDTCNHDYNMNWNVNCRSNVSEEIMRKKCDNKHNCNVEASNSVFGDPCYGTIKYLEMQYLCVNAHETLEILETQDAPGKGNQPNEKTVCEKSKMHVECEKGKLIHVIKANYGRKTLSKCNPKQNKNFNVKCSSNKSQKIMQEKCHRKNRCSVEATNSVFGDPCPKTEKYLEIQYRCVKGPTTKEITTKRTTPKGTTPKRTTPRRTTPKRTTPRGTTPKRITPKATSIRETTSKRTTPKGTTPKRITPKATSPRETTPKRTTPKGTTPKNTTPQATSPRTTTPKVINEKSTILKVIDEKSTTPKGITLKQTTSKEITSKGTTPKVTSTNGTSVKETTPIVTTLKGSTPEGNKPLSVSACEHTKLIVECPNGEVIHVLRANYGRTTLTKCNPNSIKTYDVKCLSNKSGDIVRGKCDKKRNCIVEASNSVFGDTCPNTMKYLEIQYICVPVEKTTEMLKPEITTPKSSTPKDKTPLTVSACENTKLNVECERGKVIQVLKGNYGRTTLSKCNPNNIKTWNVKCQFKNSEKVMREKCNGKRNCVIAATNSVFGDPCRDTLKYLEMQYLCIPESTIYEKNISTITSGVSVGITNVVFQTTKSSRKASKSVSNDIPTTVSNLITTFHNIRTLNPDIYITAPKISSNSPKFITNNPYHHKTGFEFSTEASVSPTMNPDIPTSNPDIRKIVSISTMGPVTPTKKPEDKTVVEVSTKDDSIPTTVYDIVTETIRQTTTPYEETSAPSISNTSNNPSGITTTKSPITECDEQDLKCFKFKCPQDMGNFPHPSSKKMFIFCINWKPRVKTCATGLVFSEKYMTCVREESLYYH